MAKKKRKKTKKSDAEKIAEKLEQVVQEVVKEGRPKKRRSASKKSGRKKKNKGEKRVPKRGFYVTKSVLEVIKAVKKYGRNRFQPQDIYAATGRNPYRKVKGKLVMTKAYKRWREIFEKLERAGYIVKKKTGYYITPAAGRLLKSRLARMQNVKGVRPKRTKKRRGRTVKSADIQKAWGIMMTDERRDKRFSALPPGKRVSKSGRVYYEYRPNRSDINPRRGL